MLIHFTVFVIDCNLTCTSTKYQMIQIKICYVAVNKQYTFYIWQSETVIDNNKENRIRLTTWVQSRSCLDKHSNTKEAAVDECNKQQVTARWKVGFPVWWSWYITVLLVTYLFVPVWYLWYTTVVLGTVNMVPLQRSGLLQVAWCNHYLMTIKFIAFAKLKSHVTNQKIYQLFFSQQQQQTWCLHFTILTFL